MRGLPGLLCVWAVFGGGDVDGWNAVDDDPRDAARSLAELFGLDGGGS